MLSNIRISPGLVVIKQRNDILNIHIKFHDHTTKKLYGRVVTTTPLVRRELNLVFTKGILFVFFLEFKYVQDASIAKSNFFEQNDTIMLL